VRHLSLFALTNVSGARVYELFFGSVRSDRPIQRFLQPASVQPRSVRVMILVRHDGSVDARAAIDRSRVLLPGALP